MNLIITPTRASLLTRTVSALLYIRLVGPPLRRFDPTRYVDSWILSGRRSAVTTNSKKRSRDILSVMTTWTKFGNFCRTEVTVVVSLIISNYFL